MDAANQCLITEELLVEAHRSSRSQTLLERLGIQVSRYGLVLTLLLIGGLKFTAGEAQGIQPLVASTPPMFWLHRIFSLPTVSDLIGAIELALAALIALRPFSANLSFISTSGAIIP